MVTPKSPEPGGDAAVVVAANRGDADACRQLVARHQDAVFAILSRMLDPRGLGREVEDLAQETFLRVFRSLDRFDPAGPARLSTWICTIATRLAINEIRRKRPSLPGEGVVELRPSRDDAHRRLEAQSSLARAIESLTPEQQAVLVLREFHGHDDATIASMLEIEPVAVRSRVCRARARLRERMKGDFDHG